MGKIFISVEGMDKTKMILRKQGRELSKLLENCNGVSCGVVRKMQRRFIG